MKLDKNSLISAGAVIASVVGVVLSWMVEDCNKKELRDEIKAEVLADLKESE